MGPEFGEGGDCDINQFSPALPDGKYPPAKPGALEQWPLEAAGGVADAAPEDVSRSKRLLGALTRPLVQVATKVAVSACQFSLKRFCLKLGASRWRGKQEHRRGSIFGQKLRTDGN
jgi:hypothetical protein